MRWKDRIGRRIKLSDLHVLLSVAQCGSMAKAASELAISHPAVSRSISDLEHTLGVRLLERNPNGVALTEFGRAMLVRSHAAFDELRQGVRDIEFLADPGIGEVRIGSTGPLAASFVSTIIDRLHRRYPRMIFHGETAEFASLERKLDERSLDLLIVRKLGTLDEGRLSFEALYDNPYFVAAGATSPWVRRRHIELADLVNELWIFPPKGNRLELLVRDVFGAKGLPCPRASVIAHSLEMTISLLGTGRYLSIQPETVFTFPRKHPFIRKLRIALPDVGGPIGILTLKSRMLSPPAQLVISCAREIAKPLAGRSKGRRG
jgi:DNA-binding transcriptional LysR family regulator